MKKITKSFLVFICCTYVLTNLLSRDIENCDDGKPRFGCKIWTVTWSGGEVSCTTGGNFSCGIF